MDLSIDKQIGVIVQKMEIVEKLFGKDKYEKVLAYAAGEAQEAIRKEAPKSLENHVINSTSGQIEVESGNLKKSVQIFKKKRTKSIYALIGPVVAANSNIKKLKGGPKIIRTDNAFYWRFVYYGAYNSAPNRFIDKARSRSQNGVLNKLKSGTQKYLDKELRNIF